MRALGISFLLIVLLAGAGYFLYQVPRIQALFQSSAPKKDPLAFLEDLPEIDSPQEEKAPEPKTSPSPPAPPPSPSEPPPVNNRVPNAELSRTLIQILRAKGLASGLSLEVSDRVVRVHGSVPTEQARKELLHVLENARESRTVDLSYLEVGSPKAEGVEP